MEENPSASGPARNSNRWAIASHLAGLVSLVMPILGPFAAGFCWLAGRGGNPFVDLHGRKSLNWQITFLFAFILVPVGVGLFDGWLKRDFSDNITFYSKKLDEAKTDQERGQAMEMLRQITQYREMKINVNLNLIKWSVILLSLVNLVLCSLNAWLAYQRNAPWYLPSFPIFRTKHLLSSH